MGLFLILNESTDQALTAKSPMFQYEVSAIDMKKEKLHIDFPEIYKNTVSKFVIKLSEAEVGSISNGAKHLYDYFKLNEFRDIKIKFIKHFSKGNLN